MASITAEVSKMLCGLEQEDYKKAVSYIEFLYGSSQKKKKEQTPEQINEAIQSLIGAIPNTGKTLEEYREERLSKYEITD